MFFIKCQCGCFYTLPEEKLNYPIPGKKRKCPGYGNVHDFNESSTLRIMNTPDINISRIPDNAKITLTIDPKW